MLEHSRSGSFAGWIEESKNYAIYRQRDRDSMLKKAKVEDAIGLRLAHDLTQIVPGKFKGAAFRKGHRVRPEDLSRLLDMGKKQIYVITLGRGEVHENEAARRIARAVTGGNLSLQGPQEGKINFISETHGLLKVNVRALQKINAVGTLILSTLHNHACVFPGQVVAGTRAIPLTISESKIRKVEKICRREKPVLRVLPFRPKKVGVVVTGSEIFEKRIQDHSAHIITRKVKAFGSRVVKKTTVQDDPFRIAEEIRLMKKAGCRVIVATGGLSVDPDDRTLEGIRQSGARVVFYGVPILPGSMSVYARLGETVILGAPACMVHDPTTALDVFLPRVLADDPISKGEIARTGHGGLCLKCQVCRYPVCPFGKGG
jgi:molybdenum cofactor synthesis domain-containing protein